MQKPKILPPGTKIIVKNGKYKGQCGVIEKNIMLGARMSRQEIIEESHGYAVKLDTGEVVGLRVTSVAELT